jgi:hypothetical protein
LSCNHNEYNNFHHILDGKLKTTLTSEKTNVCLLARQNDYFKSKDMVVVLHDPSTIRKPESRTAENLCLVKDLDNNLVNGYMTYNCVAVELDSSRVKLLRSVPYSTEQPEYVTQEELRAAAAGKLTPKRTARIKELQDSNKLINLRTIALDSVDAIGKQVHETNKEALVIHIFDRGFDDDALLAGINGTGDYLVIRMKLNRNSNEVTMSRDGVETPVKLRNLRPAGSFEKTYAKVRFKNRTFTNALGVFEWNYLDTKQGSYSVVHARFYSSSGKKIFAEPMLLVTNFDVACEQVAMLVFEMYMTRSRIEGVFKFCKENLGWENSRIPDFECVKNLLTLIFFVAGYYYEIEDELTKDETMIWLAKLGNCKGRVSHTYILRGLEVLVHYAIAKQFMAENNITDEQVYDILNSSKLNI